VQTPGFKLSIASALASKDVTLNVVDVIEADVEDEVFENTGGIAFQVLLARTLGESTYAGFVLVSFANRAS